MIKQNHLNQQFVIGGGTAGWLTALTLVKIPKHNSQVYLVESKTIPTVGAGEGSTPQIVFLLKYLGIDLDEFYEKAWATKKYGVTFDNWLNKKESFNHIFINERNIDYAYHFDSEYIIQFLKKKAIENGVVYIQDDYINSDKNGVCIEHINLKENGKLRANFVFDCTGFRRQIIGKEYKSKWIDTTKYLPVNAAIPFTRKSKKIDKEEATYTKAVALKHGWLWTIPLQGRIGCGYVHDGNLVSEEDARLEVEEYFGEKVFSQFSRPRIFFKSGYFEKPYIGNCMAIGLSASFFEPLEATSIMLTCMQLDKFIANRSVHIEHTEYTRFFNSVNNQILAFIFYHYMGVREDSEFWRGFKNRQRPELLKELTKPNGVFDLTKSEYKKILNIKDKKEIVFDLQSWKTFSKQLVEKTM